jgi:hypothetical protein
LVLRFPEEKSITEKLTTKLVQADEFVAEADVTLVFTTDQWAPSLSLRDAYKLDDTRLALHRGDIEAASKLGRVYRMIPVAS